MYRHTVQLVGERRARQYLERQPLRRLPQRCRHAGAVHEHSHKVVPLLLMLRRRARVPVAGRTPPYAISNDSDNVRTILVSSGTNNGANSLDRGHEQVGGKYINVRFEASLSQT